MMKGLLMRVTVVVSALVLFTACEKEEPKIRNIEGTYEGWLTKNDMKSGETVFDNSVEAKAEVTITGENEIEVHCYSSDFDTTFVLNYYGHQDSAYVCFTGEDFEEMYGHMLGGGHMMGGMMGDINNGETEWMHHMNDEHDEDDEHFGGFDMDDHTFSYTFRMKNGEIPYELHFQGSKQ
jgi:hypothetical protein